ncbi:MAG TPA: hypothetical protein VF807_02390 [Ktedonobacterales bacterium]
MSEDGFGPIFLDIEGTAFPEDGWEDFGGYLLFEWLVSSVRWLHEETDAPCIYRFMDGPYEFHATRVAPQHLALTFYERRAGGDIRRLKVAPAVVGQDAFFGALLAGARKIQWEQSRSQVDEMIRILTQQAV